MNSLPTEVDFDPWEGNLDAQCAWRNFGGLTLDEAHKKFRENPCNYQEDFMFMGGQAFAYYFPVIEDFLKDVAAQTEHGGSQAWILACGIEQQFDGEVVPEVRELGPRAVALAEFVQMNLQLFEPDPVYGMRVDVAWRKLENRVREFLRSH